MFIDPIIVISVIYLFVMSIYIVIASACKIPYNGIKNKLVLCISGFLLIFSITRFIYIGIWLSLSLSVLFSIMATWYGLLFGNIVAGYKKALISGTSQQQSEEAFLKRP